MPAAKSRNSLPSDIFNANAAPALGYQRIRARIAGRDEASRRPRRRRLLWVPGQWQISFGPYCACNSCFVIKRSPRQIRLSWPGAESSHESIADRWADAARPPIPGIGIVHSADPFRAHKMARIFGGSVLVAAEEARSSAGGEHAQVLARANALRARPRPALCGWRELPIRVWRACA